ncbi:MAG TPA: imelysin family protein [Iamia sp.]|nr:imelysin family protein [Iamia sp.]
MTLPRRLFTVVVAAGLAVGLVACSDASDQPSTDGSADGGSTEIVLTGIADDTIIPSYRRLGDAFAGLASDLDALCAEPSPDALATAQESWRTVARSWQGTRGGAVGPSMDRRLMADVAFRARPDPVEDLLASDEPIDTETLRSKGSTFHGISLMEALLFGEQAIALATPGGARTCEFLVNVLPVSADAVAVVLADWEDGDEPYRETLAAGPEGDPLGSVDALTNQVIACLTAIDDNGIRDLALAETLDDALSTRRDGPGAFVMAEHRALLDSLATVVEGDPDDDGDGLVALVAARSPDTATRLTELVAAAVGAFAALPDSADAAYTDAHDDLVAASEAVAALKVLMTTEVASQLGITVRFSDADGDS